MPLLNYTTEVPASKSIAEITRILQEGGASAIMLETGVDREVCAVSFMLVTTFGRIPYKIPANIPAVILAINSQIKAETERQRKSRYNRRIPLNLFNNKAQAERIAWRIAKDWLEVQMAMHTLGSAKLEQVMLPFADAGGGKTFYDRLVERGSLALPSPTAEEPHNVTAEV